MSFKPKTIIQTAIFFLVIVTASCNKDQIANTPSGSLSVRGVITVDNQAVKGATVQIDSILNWRTTTDDAGKFEIKDVSQGIHGFVVQKSLGDGKVVSQSTTISISGEDLDLGSIKLPLPSAMYPIDSSSVTISSVLLQWSTTTDEEFREYKLYRKEDPGLDETTGKLIYVTTSRIDTTFLDKDVVTSGTYYYRVFILSSFGKLGGSNLASATLPAINFILNPSFELSSNGLLPDNWEIIGNETQRNVTTLSTEFAHDGAKSMKMLWTDTSFVPHIPSDLDQYIAQTTDFIIGRKYRFSFWSKVDSGVINVVLATPGYLKSFDVTPTIGWKKDSVIFTFTQNGYIIVNSSPSVQGTGVKGFVKGWIDDLRLSIEPK
jgi:hypothetical protein